MFTAGSHNSKYHNRVAHATAQTPVPKHINPAFRLELDVRAGRDVQQLLAGHIERVGEPLDDDGGSGEPRHRFSWHRLGTMQMPGVLQVGSLERLDGRSLE